MKENPISIYVEDLVKEYARKGQEPLRANDHLNFNVKRGEIFGLLGPNGAGKSSLVHQILGLLVPTSGKICLNGISINEHPDYAKDVVGFLPQTALSMRYIEVDRALIYTGCLRGQSEQEAREQAANLIKELEMEPFAKQFVDNLSGGMLRLTNFAMALMGDPKFLILDEPTNELDPHKRSLVWNLIKRLNEEKGVTCILVTHNVLEAEKVVHRVAVMQDGKIVALGTPGELKERSHGNIRLGFQYRDGVEPDEEKIQHLTTLGTMEEVRDKQYNLHLAPDQVSKAVDLSINELGLDNIENFQLNPPSLEDIYLEIHHTDSDDWKIQAEEARAKAVKLAGGEIERPAEEVKTEVNKKKSWKKGFVDFKFLWLEQLLEARTTWYWNSIFSIFMPLMMLFGFTRLGSGLKDDFSLVYFISGTIIFALAAEGVMILANRIGFMKAEKMMLYYASLPISKVAFICASLLARILIVIPGMIVPLIAGSLIYGVELQLSSLWLILLLPLTALTLSCIGMTLGSLLESVELISVVGNITLFILLLLAPILMPMEALPLPLQYFSYILPPTYAAEAIRFAISGDIGNPLFMVDIIILIAVTVLSFIATVKWLSWRTK